MARIEIPASASGVPKEASTPTAAKEKGPSILKSDHRSSEPVTSGTDVSGQMIESSSAVRVTEKNAVVEVAQAGIGASGASLTTVQVPGISEKRCIRPRPWRRARVHWRRGRCGRGKDR